MDKSGVSSVDGDVSIGEIIQDAIAEQDFKVSWCECNTTCSTKKCPCREVGADCTRHCNCGTKRLSCKNNKPVRIIPYFLILYLYSIYITRPILFIARPACSITQNIDEVLLFILKFILFIIWEWGISYTTCIWTGYSYPPFKFEHAYNKWQCESMLLNLFQMFIVNHPSMEILYHSVGIIL